jgi:hypothetical protein
MRIARIEPVALRTPLHLGDLQGNRFCIKIRDIVIDSDSDIDVAEEKSTEEATSRENLAATESNATATNPNATATNPNATATGSKLAAIDLRVRAAAEALRQSGFINYYGAQRVGVYATDGGVSHRIGMYVCVHIPCMFVKYLWRSESGVVCN